MKTGSFRLFFSLLVFIVSLITPACRPDEGEGGSSSVSQDQAWTDWIRANLHPIRTLEPSATDDSDLEFLRPLLQGRTLVQLGENSHGVAEFDRAKARLVKFLHAKLGYDVIAFESSMFECYLAERQAAEWTPLQCMGRSIFQIWHARETLELFEYIKQTRQTERPLVLAGFDVQVSSFSGVRRRPECFRRTLEVIDPAYAETVAERDDGFLAGYLKAETDFLREHGAEWRGFYRELTDYFDAHMAELVQLHAQEPLLPVVMRQTAWSMGRFIEMHGGDSVDEYASTTIRDRAMAENVGVLMQRLYPGKKIILWAHNVHIQSNRPGAYQYPFTNMGSLLLERFRPTLYTVGFYMNQGQAGTNARKTYTILPARNGTVEELLSRAGQEYGMVDLLHQASGAGTSWMFQPLDARDWGTASHSMVSRDQFDALFYVNTSHVPQYLVFRDTP